MKDLLVNLMLLIVALIGLGLNIWWALLVSKREVHNWPVGIVSVLLLIALSIGTFLLNNIPINYSEIAKNLILLFIYIYGWWLWNKSTGSDGRISDVRSDEKITWIFLVFVGIVISLSEYMQGYLQPEYIARYINLMPPVILANLRKYVEVEALYAGVQGVTLVFVLFSILNIVQKRVAGFEWWILGCFVMIFKHIFEYDSYFSFLFILRDVILLIIGFIGLREWRKAAQEYRAQEQTVGQ